MPIFQATALSTFTQAKQKNKQPLPAKMITMKKWLLHIIYKLYNFLLAYIFPGKVKESNSIGKRPATAYKAAFVPVKSRFIVISSAPGEKTLWRHAVFRCGISA